MGINWTLIVVVAILLVSAIVGSIKGFVKMVVSFLSVAVTIVLVWLAQPYINDFLVNNTTFYTSIKEKCVSYVEEELNNKIEEKNIKNETPQVVATEGDDMLKNSWLSIVKEYTESAKEKAGEAIENTVAGFSDAIGGTLATIILNIIVFIITFIIITILIRVGFFALNIITKLPVIHTLNKTAGLILGLLIGIITVWLLMMIVIIFFNTSIGSIVLMDVESNQFLKFIYSANPIIHILF